MAMTHGMTTALPYGLPVWPQPVWEHVCVDADRRTRLRRLARAYKTADERAVQARLDLVAEVKAALDAGEKQTDVVKEIGYTREWVRRHTTAKD
jgi:hypothetical protein